MVQCVPSISENMNSIPSLKQTNPPTPQILLEMVVYSFKPSTWEAERDEPVSSRPG